MTDVNVVPRIKCDSCGRESDKWSSTITNGNPGGWVEPYGWGHAHASGLFADKEIHFKDLCPACLESVINSLSDYVKT